MHRKLVYLWKRCWLTKMFLLKHKQMETGGNDVTVNSAWQNSVSLNVIYFCWFANERFLGERIERVEKKFGVFTVMKDIHYNERGFLTLVYF